MDGNIRSQLLVALTAGANRGSVVQGLLSQLSDSDPTVSLISQYLAQRQEQGSENYVDALPTEDAGEQVEAEEQTRALTQALTQLREKVNGMYAELRRLRDRNETLAAALGACYLCWGEDLECPNCRGRGLPGYSYPERRLFMEYVAPAVRALQLWENANKRFGRDARAGASTSQLANE